MKRIKASELQNQFPATHECLMTMCSENYQYFEIGEEVQNEEITDFAWDMEISSLEAIRAELASADFEIIDVDEVTVDMSWASV